MLAHWGDAAIVADLVVRSPHSLLHQVTDAREQSSGHVNPDGWGIGWYLGARAEPERYRTARAMTDDPDGVAALEELKAARFVAHVRHKSPGSRTDAAGSAPFRSGRWLFAHNGFVAGYRDGASALLLAELSPSRRDALQGDADSEVLFGLVLDRIGAGLPPAEALGGLVARLGARDGRYNVVLTDGHDLFATRWANTLYQRGGDAGWDLASEPYDDAPGWEPVADRSLVHIDTLGDLAVHPL